MTNIQAAPRPKHSLHSPEITLMDSFATLAIFFASISGSSDIPTNADDGGSGNNAYCIVAWEFLSVHNAGNDACMFIAVFSLHLNSIPSPR